MSRTDICWSPTAVQYVTQIDVGGLDLDDPYADAVFRAIHRPLPVRRGWGDETSSATEEEVLRAFVGEITSNEPRLFFITGQVGTGKSHMVRWLRSQVGAHPKWHIVYVEKRNTSLKRVIESILEGVDTPKAQQLRRALDEASSAIATDEEAIDALLLRLDLLVKFDTSTDIEGLSDLDESELKDLRGKADRLLGDYTFRKALSVKGGPIERIVRLARGGTDPDEAIDENDLHLRQEDFRVDFSMFRDSGEFENLVKSVIANTGLRSDIAALCDAYLPQAKAEVFTGQATDLLEIFHDVRAEIAGRGQELCLFIEDLVLLHGIDKQLAQALTVPASKDLCKLRAAIAVTEGYLNGVHTFTDRGTQFKLDIDTAAISSEGLRDFVSHYLNAGRIEAATLRELLPGDRTPNACDVCSVRPGCHKTFGKSSSGYGFYPLNGPAVDRLVAFASPKNFQPRNILREVIRAPLEVAEYEIPRPGRFPSSDFAKALDENRKELSSEVRAKIRRDNRTNAEAEISLRAFYATSPLIDDPELIEVANDFAVELTRSVTQDPDPDPDPDPTPTQSTRMIDELEKWANGDGQLSARTALKIRRYVCDSTVAELRSGPYGLSIRVPRKNEWKIGTHALSITDVVIESALGGGMRAEPAAAFVIRVTDEDAVVVRGILSALESGRLDTVDKGRWYFDFHSRVVDFAESIATLAQAPSRAGLVGALLTLSILRNVSQNPGRNLAEALPAMLWPTLPPNLNPSIRDFYNETKALREESLLILRDAQTAAKGAGKPSIFDIGPMLTDMQKNLAAKHVDDETSANKDAESARILRSLASKQSRASAKIWSEVERLVERVGHSLSTDEDLPMTLRNVDRLVDEGQRRAVLPRADSRTAYHGLRSHVETDQMTTFRKLSTTVQVGPTAANLWDVVHDPRPALNALEGYASFTKRLLTEMEANLDIPATIGPGDTRALITEFRGLADELDHLSAGQE